MAAKLLIVSFAILRYGPINWSFWISFPATESRRQSLHPCFTWAPPDNYFCFPDLKQVKQHDRWQKQSSGSVRGTSRLSSVKTAALYQKTQHGIFSFWPLHLRKTFLLFSNAGFRNSLQKVFLRKAVMKICSKFTGENPLRSVISVMPPVWCHINFVRFHQFVIVVFLMIHWKVFFFQDPAQPVLTGWNNFPTLYVSTSTTTCFRSSSVYFFPINIHIGMFFYDFFVRKNKYLVKVFWQ